MGVFQSLSGMLTVELTGADISGTLQKINKAGIPVFDIRIIGELSALMRIYRRDLKGLRNITQRRGDSLRIRNRNGIYWSGKRLLRRPVLAIGMLLFLVLGMYLPTRVLFVRVEGNETVPTKLILAAAEENGIGFGASRREVRSEKVKNALLSAVPQLQWAGVNTQGCVAVISVRERAVTEEAEKTDQVSNIVAARDGIILSVTVADGNGLCTVGQAVRAGDILISGFTDCGLCVTATRAEGEVIARTRRTITVKTAAETETRGDLQVRHTKYSLILGKKRINFYKGSGISDGSCVKMYTEYCLTLPGGFSLPVTLVKETFSSYDARTEAVAEEDARVRLTEFADTYLRRQMIAGTISDRTEVLSGENGAWTLAGEYACTEMIGQVQTEEIGVIP